MDYFLKEELEQLLLKSFIKKKLIIKKGKSVSNWFLLYYRKINDNFFERFKGINERENFLKLKKWKIGLNLLNWKYFNNFDMMNEKIDIINDNNNNNNKNIGKVIILDDIVLEYEILSLVKFLRFYFNYFSGINVDNNNYNKFKNLIDSNKIFYNKKNVSFYYDLLNEYRFKDKDKDFNSLNFYKRLKIFYKDDFGKNKFFKELFNILLDYETIFKFIRINDKLFFYKLKMVKKLECGLDYFFFKKEYNIYNNIFKKVINCGGFNFFSVGMNRDIKYNLAKIKENIVSKIYYDSEVEEDYNQISHWFKVDEDFLFADDFENLYELDSLVLESNLNFIYKNKYADISSKIYKINEVNKIKNLKVNFSNLLKKKEKGDKLDLELFFFFSLNSIRQNKELKIINNLVNKKCKSLFKNVFRGDKKQNFLIWRMFIEGQENFKIVNSKFWVDFRERLDILELKERLYDYINLKYRDDMNKLINLYGDYYFVSVDWIDFNMVGLGIQDNLPFLNSVLDFYKYDKYNYNRSEKIIQNLNDLIVVKLNENDNEIDKLLVSLNNLNFFYKKNLNYKYNNDFLVIKNYIKLLKQKYELKKVNILSSLIVELKNVSKDNNNKLVLFLMNNLIKENYLYFDFYVSSEFTLNNELTIINKISKFKEDKIDIWLKKWRIDMLLNLKKNMIVNVDNLLKIFLMYKYEIDFKFKNLFRSNKFLNLLKFCRDMNFFYLNYSLSFFSLILKNLKKKNINKLKKVKLFNKSFDDNSVNFNLTLLDWQYNIIFKFKYVLDMNYNFIVFDLAKLSNSFFFYNLGLENDFSIKNELNNNVKLVKKLSNYLNKVFYFDIFYKFKMEIDKLNFENYYFCKLGKNNKDFVSSLKKIFFFKQLFKLNKIKVDMKKEKNIFFNLNIENYLLFYKWLWSCYYKYNDNLLVDLYFLKNMVDNLFLYFLEYEKLVNLNNYNYLRFLKIRENLDLNVELFNDLNVFLKVYYNDFNFDNEIFIEDLKDKIKLEYKDNWNNNLWNINWFDNLYMIDNISLFVDNEMNYDKDFLVWHWDGVFPIIENMYNDVESMVGLFLYCDYNIGLFLKDINFKEVDIKKEEFNFKSLIGLKNFWKKLKIQNIEKENDEFFKYINNLDLNLISLNIIKYILNNLFNIYSYKDYINFVDGNKKEFLDIQKKLNMDSIYDVKTFIYFLKYYYKKNNIFFEKKNKSFNSFLSMHIFLDDFFDSLIVKKETNRYGFDKNIFFKILYDNKKKNEKVRNSIVNLKKDNNKEDDDFFDELNFIEDGLFDKNIFNNKKYLYKKNKISLMKNINNLNLNNNVLFRSLLYYYDTSFFEKLYAYLSFNRDIFIIEDDLIKFYKFFNDLKKFRKVVKKYTMDDNFISDYRYEEFNPLKREFKKDLVEYDLELINSLKSYFLLEGNNFEIFFKLIDKNINFLKSDIWFLLLKGKKGENMIRRFGTHQWLIFYLKNLIEVKNSWWFFYLLKDNIKYSYYLPKVNFNDYENLMDYSKRLIKYNKYFIKRKFWEKGISFINIKENRYIKNRYDKYKVKRLIDLKNNFIKVYWIYIQGLLDSVYNQYTSSYLFNYRFFRQYIFYIYLKYYFKRSLIFVDSRNYKRKLFFLKKRMYVELNKSKIKRLVGQSFQFRWLKFKLFKLNKIFEREKKTEKNVFYPMLVGDLINNVFFNYFSLLSSTSIGLTKIKLFFLKFKILYKLNFNMKFNFKNKNEKKNINFLNLRKYYLFKFSKYYFLKARMPLWFQLKLKKIGFIEYENKNNLYLYLEKKINFNILNLNMKSLDNFFFLNDKFNLDLLKVNLLKNVLVEYNNFFGFNSRISKNFIKKIGFNKAFIKVLDDYWSIYKKLEKGSFNSFTNFWEWLKFLKKGINLEENINKNFKKSKDNKIDFLKKNNFNIYNMNYNLNKNVNSDWGWIYWYMWWLNFIEDFVGVNWEDIHSFPYYEEQLKTFVNLIYKVGYKKIDNKYKSDYPLDLYNLRLFQYFPYKYGQKSWLMLLLPEIEIFNFSPFYDLNYFNLWDCDNKVFLIRNVEYNKRNFINLQFLLLEFMNLKKKNNSNMFLDDLLNNFYKYKEFLLNIEFLKGEYYILYFFLKKLGLWMNLKKKNKNFIFKNKKDKIKIKNVYINLFNNTNNLYKKYNKIWDSGLIFKKDINVYNKKWQYNLNKMLNDIIYVKIGRRSYGRKNIDSKIYVDFDSSFIEGVFRFELLEGCNYEFKENFQNLDGIINQNNSLIDSDLDTQWMSEVEFISSFFDKNLLNLNLMILKKLLKLFNNNINFLYNMNFDYLKKIIVNKFNLNVDKSFIIFLNKISKVKNVNFNKVDDLIFYLENNVNLNDVLDNNLNYLNKNKLSINMKELKIISKILKKIKVVNLKDLKEILLNKNSDFKVYGKFFKILLLNLLKDIKKNVMLSGSFNLILNKLNLKVKNLNISILYSYKKELDDIFFLLVNLFNDVKVNYFLKNNLNMDYIFKFLIDVFQEYTTKERLNLKYNESNFVYLTNSMSDLFTLEKIYWNKISNLIWNVYYNFVDIEIFGDEFYRNKYLKYNQFLLTEFDFDNEKLIKNLPEYFLDYLWGKSETFFQEDLELNKDNLMFSNSLLLLEFKKFWENNLYFWKKMKLNYLKINSNNVILNSISPFFLYYFSFKFEVFSNLKNIVKKKDGFLAYKKFKLLLFFRLKNVYIFFFKYFFYDFFFKSINVIWLIISKFYSKKYMSDNELGVDILYKEDIWSNEDFYMKELETNEFKSIFDKIFNRGLINKESKILLKIKYIFLIINNNMFNIFDFIFIYIFKLLQLKLNINFKFFWNRRKYNFLKNYIYKRELMVEIFLSMFIFFIYFKFMVFLISLIGILFLLILYIFYICFEWYFVDDKNEFYEYFENYEYDNDEYSYDFSRKKNVEEDVRLDWDYNDGSLEFPNNLDLHDELKHVGDWNYSHSFQNYSMWNNMEDEDFLHGYMLDEDNSFLSDINVVDSNVVADDWILDVYEEWTEPEESWPVFFFLWIRVFLFIFCFFYFILIFFICLYFIMDSYFFPLIFQEFIKNFGKIFFVDFGYESKFVSHIMWYWKLVNFLEF